MEGKLRDLHLRQSWCYRHPLYELMTESFVANSTKIGSKKSSDAEKLIILTGANYSGKSVYIKQVALIVYMAHIGRHDFCNTSISITLCSFVPAEAAEIGLTDKILSRIQTRESVSKKESAFALDIEQLSHILRNATESSLVLLDEFGKGTATKDGISLFSAVMEHFSYKKDHCPNVLAVTHFHGNKYFCERINLLEIFHLRLLDHLPITYYTMEITMPRQDALTYLYRLVISFNKKSMLLHRIVKGFSQSSWGSYCASKAGMPKKIVKRGISWYFANADNV